MKNKATILLLLLSLSATLALAQDVNETMYQAYLQRSKPLWNKALETQLKASPQNELQLALVYFSLLNNTMATKDEKFFDAHVDDAKKLLKNIIDKNSKSGNAKGMLSAIYGLEIGYSSFKGITLGSKSGSLAELATELEPTSALVWRLYGTNKFYTPSAFGGDLKEAITALEKSIQLFESNQSSLKNNWLYIDTIVLLGQAYQKNNDRSKAINTYQKALTVEPDFVYAKKLLEKIKTQKL